MKDFKVRIGNYTWTVKFVDQKEIPGNNGEAHYLTQTIYLRNDMPSLATRNVFIHEVVHALLGTQGRIFQKRYTDEDICEFIAWRFNEIQDIIETYERNEKQ